MGTIKRTLKEAVRKLAYTTSVDQLKKRGIKRVNVVGLDRIAQLVEEAVHRSLRNRLLVADREALAGETKEEFLRLLRSNEELKERQVRAEEEASSLRLELTQLRQELASRLSEAAAAHRPGYVDQDEKIRLLVHTALADVCERMPEGQRLEERVLEVVMSVVETERRDAEATTEAVRDRNVSLLQRRIAKLTQSLEETEARLAQVATAKHVDSGIASVYREVQGLGADEAYYEKKKELMAGIFAANLKLQKKA